jgi:hypothetical protein
VISQIDRKPVSLISRQARFSLKRLAPGAENGLMSQTQIRARRGAHEKRKPNTSSVQYVTQPSATNAPRIHSKTSSSLRFTWFVLAGLTQIFVVLSALAGKADRTLPSVTLTSPANGATVSGTITVAANASDNVGVAKVEFYRDGSTLIGTDTSAAYSWSFNTATLVNGSHSFSAKAYDAAGNIAASAVSTVTVSNDAPPSVTLTSPVNGATVSGTITVAANASDNIGVTKVEFYRDGSTLIGSDTTAPYSVSFSTTTLANGTHSFSAKAYDTAGQSTTSAISTLTVSNPVTDAPPSVTLTSPVNGATVSGTITVAANASDNVGVTKVEFYRDGSTLIGTDTTAAFSVGFSTTMLANGTHSFYAKAYDTAGQSTTSATSTVTVSNTVTDPPPLVTLTSPINGATVSGNITVAANASDNIGVTKVEFYRDGSTLIGSDTTAPYSVSFDTTTLANGSHSFYAKAYDTAGQSTTSVTSTVTVSNVTDAPPSVTLTSPVSGATVSGTITVAANASDNVGVAKVEFYRDGSTLIGTDTTGAYSVSFDTTTLPNGTHSFYAKAYDTAGNWGTSASVAVTVGATSASGSVLMATDLSTASQDNGKAVATSKVDGSVFITGDLSGQLFVAKFSSGGGNAPMWSYSYGTGYGKGIAVDSSGYIYAAAGSAPSGYPYTSSFVLKLNSSGAQVSGQLWPKSNGFGINGAADATAIAIDGNNDVLVTGSFWGTLDFGKGPVTAVTGCDFFLAKYHADGSVVFVNTVAASSSLSGRGVGADSSNNIYVAGNLQGIANFGGTSISSVAASATSPFVVKYNLSGGHTWSKSFPNSGGAVSVCGIGVSPNGDFAITGTYANSFDIGGGLYTTAWTFGGYVAKFTGSASLAPGYQWSRNLAASSGVVLPYGVAADSTGNVALTGSLQGSFAFDSGTVSIVGSKDIVVANYSSTGTSWGKSFGSSQADSGNGIAFDSSNNVIATGVYNYSMTIGTTTLPWTSMSDTCVFKLAK